MKHALTLAVFSIFSTFVVVPAAAQSNYGQPQSFNAATDTVHGTIVNYDGRYALRVRDDRGYVDRITFDPGTAFKPRRLQLVPGQSVTIVGQPRGSTLFAYEISGAAPTSSYRPPADMRSLAPADEYFGPLRMSILGIQNWIRDSGPRVDDSRGGDLGSFYQHAQLVEASLRDWDSKYPSDAWLPRTYLMLEQLYERTNDGPIRRHAAEIAAWMIDRYPSSPESRELRSERSDIQTRPRSTAGNFSRPVDARPLRHMEYAMTQAVNGRTVRSDLTLDLLSVDGDRGATINLTQNGKSLVLDVDKHGSMTSSDIVAMSPEATMLVQFFALGAQNMTGIDRGERWSADGTSYRLVDSRSGKFEIEFARAANPIEGRAGSSGRLVYDVQKVVPVSFDADADRIHIAARLVSDSQP